MSCRAIGESRWRDMIYSSSGVPALQDRQGEVENSEHRRELVLWSVEASPSKRTEIFPNSHEHPSAIPSHRACNGKIGRDSAAGACVKDGRRRETLDSDQTLMPLLGY